MNAKNIQEVENKWLQTLELELRQEMDKAPSVVSSHDLGHIKRVWKYVNQIANNMDVDWEILIAATFFHDIGRHYPEGIREHGPISAPFAKKLLKKINFPEDKVDDTLTAIKYHDESFPPEKRPKIEAKILYDADKLDVFGAVGVSRFLIFNAMRGKTLNETLDYTLDNLPLRFQRLELEETKKVAKPEYKYALDYFKKLKQELE
jgi:uncharacterized protein